MINKTKEQGSAVSASLVGGKGSNTFLPISPPAPPLNCTPPRYNTSLTSRVLSTINLQAGRGSSWRDPLGKFDFSGKLGICENGLKWVGRRMWASDIALAEAFVSVFLMLWRCYV